MLVDNTPYRTVWMEGSTVKMIDQTLLPHEFKIISLSTHKDTSQAIYGMKVRGAGAIGGAAGHAMAQAVLEAPLPSEMQSSPASDSSFREYIEKGKKTIESTRPTAQNLFYATNRVYNAIQNLSPQEAREKAVKEAQAVADQDSENCRQIGIHGAALLKSGAKVATHCNAGWLAFVDYGSALSPVYQATREGKDIFVYADETRPRSQGASLTSWELLNEGIDHKIIPDNTTGFLMRRKEIDIMIVGSDRIAANGDIANKIGTYEKAVCARENNIPFYVAAPTTTIDFNCPSGHQIPIEERSEDEVHYVYGVDDHGRTSRVRISPKGSRALNLAFDVTPAGLITGIITEKGIFKPNELHKLKD